MTDEQRCATCLYWWPRQPGDSGRCATPSGMWAVVSVDAAVQIHTFHDHGCRSWKPRGDA